MRILVTGGTGTIGSALARRLRERGDEVCLLARAGGDRSRLADVDGLQWLEGDVRDAASVRAAVVRADPEVVFHLASTPFNPPTISTQTHLETIVGGTAYLLEALTGRRGVRVVAAGSAAEYGSGSGLREDHPMQPGTVLGAAKASATLLLQASARRHALATVILRIFTPFGPGEPMTRLIPHTIERALRGEDVAMTEGRQQRDYFYLSDLIDALERAAERPVPPGSVINICSGQGRAVRDVVDRVLELMGRPVRLLAGAIPTRPDELMELSGDNRLARELLGWTPRVAFDEGLRRTIAWYTERANALATSGPAHGTLAMTECRLA